MLIFPLPPIQIVMSEMFDKSQMSESFDVPAGCVCWTIRTTLIFHSSANLQPLKEK